jgi:hypothetical protein
MLGPDRRGAWVPAARLAEIADCCIVGAVDEERFWGRPLSLWQRFAAACQDGIGFERELNGFAGTGRFVDSEDDFDGAAALAAVDRGSAVLANGVDEIAELPGVAVVADGGWVAGAAAGAFRLGHAFADGLVFLVRPGEVPNLEVLFFQDGGAGAAVNFDPLEIAGIDGGSGFDHAEGAIGKAERGDGGVFHFDLFVGERGGEGADFDNRTHQPSEQIDTVDGLVHEGAAAVESPGSAPGPAVIILLRAEPLDVGVANGESAEAAGVNGAFQFVGGVVEAGLKNRGKLDAVFFAFADDAVALSQGDFERLFDDDVLAGAGGGQRGLQVSAARRGDRDGGDLPISKHCGKGWVGGAAGFGGEFFG